MKRWVRLLLLLTGAGIVAVLAELADPGTQWTALAIIGGAIAAGELIELSPPERSPIPISFAYAVVLAQRSSVADAAIVLLVALVAASILRVDPASVGARLARLVVHFLACLSAVAVFHVASSGLGELETRPRLLLTLLLAALAPLAVAEVARMVQERTLAIPLEGRSADLTLVASATLMGISDVGMSGQGGMGLWGPAVFTIPLVAAWYSYEHLGEIQRTYRQTIRALGAAPELGRMVRDGHSERVSSLSVDIAREMGFSRVETEQLETAALLHHLGEVCLDEPEDGRRPEPTAVAESGAAILRTTELLAPAGDILAAEVWSPVRRDGGPRALVAGQILKISSAFDELSDGRVDRADAALEALHSVPQYVYDAEVLRALEIVLDQRGVLSPA